MRPETALWTERLVQLRRVLIRSLLLVTGAAVLAYVLSDPVLADLMKHMPGGGLVFLSPTEAFVTRIKLALAGGFVLAAPLLLGQLYGFVKPLLPEERRRGAVWLIPLSFVLFSAGAAFGYFVLLPVALRFLLGFQGPDLEPMLAVGPYVGFVTMLVLPLGLIFQLPVVAVFLTRIGVLDPYQVGARRKYAVLIIVVLSALLTPPDVFSQLLMAGPLLLLFEISLLAARIAARRGREKG